MGVKLGLSHSGRNTDSGCWGEYVDLREGERLEKTAWWWAP